MVEAKKKVMLCFYKGDIENDISILEDLDSKGFEVHLFNDIDETNLKYDILLNIIKEVCGNKECHYDIYISSNVKEFIMLQYILYKDCISAALYLNRNPVHFQLEELYRLILNTNLNKNLSSFYALKKEDSMFISYHIFNGDFKLDIFDKCAGNIVYNLKGVNHVFSVSNDENIKVINLDNSKNKGNYNYHFNLDYLDEFLQVTYSCSESINEFIKSHSFICSRLKELNNKISNLLDFEKRIVKFKLENELYKDENKDTHKIFLSSILLDIFNDKKYLKYLISLLIKSKSISKYNKFFAYYQCVRYIFINKNTINESILQINEKLYNSIFGQFSQISKKHKYIPRDKRNKELVFVFTSQFLSTNHAPSKLALDVCYNLVNGLNKKVILINTKEVLTHKGLIPMANIVGANVMDNLNNVNTVTYKDINIPFYQPEVSMPDDSEIENILNIVVKNKPNLIINIGTCLVGDLCTSIVPTATIPLGNDGYSKSTFYLVNDEKEYEEYNKKYSRNSKSLIISKFSFELKPKKHTFTKKQLEIPSNKFIIAVVGNRLNEEIDEGFLEVLEKSCKCNNAYVLFIDKFKFNQLQAGKYKNLMNNCKSMGYQEDLLAIIENTDIYVNPNRSGGGTSAIYSIYAGKPVVTLNHGDVANNIGKEFWVHTYDEMYHTIDKYYNDKSFYNYKSMIAKEKALKLTDVSKYVEDVYEQIIINPLF